LPSNIDYLKRLRKCKILRAAGCQDKVRIMIIGRSGIGEAVDSIQWPDYNEENMIKGGTL